MCVLRHRAPVRRATARARRVNAVEDVAGWVAPAATMIAAMMTAANLGVRVTGWGFVVFTVGSIAWTIIGVSTGQANLIFANGFLTLVNVVGIWRWLGREATYHDKTVAVAQRSQTITHAPTLTPAAALVGVDVRDVDGQTLANVVDTMIGCDDGRIRALLVRHGGGVGGVGERIVMLDEGHFALTGAGIETSLDVSQLDRLEPVQS